MAIGEERIDKFNVINNKYGQIKLLTPTDCVKDRLAAYYHWDDLQSLEQALLVAKDNKVNITAIKKWSVKEKQLEKFKVFFRKYKN